MELEILQNHFEVVYKEYKDYESYLASIKDETIKQREGFNERAVKGGEHIDTLVSALFDISIKPIQIEDDLRVLKDRLISVYDAYKIVIDFPENIKEEMKNLQRPFQAYRLSGDVLVDIDKDKNDKFREEARKAHTEIIQNMTKS